MELQDASNEKEFIEAVRGVFKAYVPESDAWAKPNFFDINATIIGGFFWSAINEVRIGIDKRLNPQTAVGSHLDVLASQPPMNLKRRGAVKAEGAIEVNLKINTVPKGYEFKTAQDQAYIAIEETLLTDGKGLVNVQAKLAGKNSNSIASQGLTAKDGTALSLGIYGGFDVECDEQLRRRLFTAKTEYHTFSSQCDVQDKIADFRGVTRSWAVQKNGELVFMFLMENKYPCGIPLQSDIDEILNYFKQGCRANPYNLPKLVAPKSVPLSPEIEWGKAVDICQVTTDMQDWLRANYELGEGVRAIEIQAWLSENYGEYNPKLNCCNDYPAICDTIYNCVELIGCGG